MTSQADLFATPLLPHGLGLPHREPRPSLAASLPRRVPVSWQQRLDRAGPVPLELHISALWTGVIVEVLSHGGARFFLRRDDTVEGPHPRDGRDYRAVFLAPAEARALARRHRLVLAASPGAVSVVLVLAGDDVPAWADLTAWLDGIEAAAAAHA